MIVLEETTKPCASCPNTAHVAITFKLNKNDLWKRLHICKECEAKLIRILQEDLGASK